MTRKTSIPANMLRYSPMWNLFSKYVFFVHRLFYRTIAIEGLENIPSGEPVIFAPNHQNALMDPMLVIATCKQQVVFLARADIFKNPLLRRFFHGLKILPVYRIRDGKENLGKNDESFEQIIEVLEHRLPVGIFPEAQHSNKRHLLTLRKAVPRIAFMAEERNNFGLGVKVVPVGIYYSKYNTFRTIAHVRYGIPVSISKYADLYRENDQKAFLALRDEMAGQLDRLAINIRNLQMYDIYESVRALYVKQLIKRFQLGKLTQINRFRADKITIAALDAYSENDPQGMDKLCKQVEEYESLKKQYSLSDQSIEKPRLNLFRLIASSLLLLLGLPVFAFGLLNNALVYFIPKLLVLKIKDMQFHSSVKFGWAVFVAPLLYVLQSLVFALIFDTWLWALVYLLSLPLSGLLAQAYYEWLALIIRDFRKLRLRNTRPAEFRKMIKLHHSIVLQLNRITAKMPNTQ
ncbi:MAG TPA: 1-acyl-sn-glycerol-3-phosphate acyltransferase [Bacteroidales bacterium]|nr:1-acyl-sn-glycerol-3-phosphate acyltransferase [Bacteroidales bacterium]